MRPGRSAAPSRGSGTGFPASRGREAKCTGTAVPAAPGGAPRHASLPRRPAPGRRGPPVETAGPGEGRPCAAKHPSRRRDPFYKEGEMSARVSPPGARRRHPCGPGAAASVCGLAGSRPVRFRPRLWTGVGPGACAGRNGARTRARTWTPPVDNVTRNERTCRRNSTAVPRGGTGDGEPRKQRIGSPTARSLLPACAAGDRLAWVARRRRRRGEPRSWKNPRPRTRRGLGVRKWAGWGSNPRPFG